MDLSLHGKGVCWPSIQRLKSATILNFKMNAVPEDKIELRRARDRAYYREYVKRPGVMERIRKKSREKARVRRLRIKQEANPDVLLKIREAKKRSYRKCIDKCGPDFWAKKRAYYHQNRERISIQRKRKFRECPERALWQSAKGRAKRAGLPFSISIGDIEIPGDCPVLGIPIVLAAGKMNDNMPSIDRIVPEIGYVPGNIRVISWRANRLKSDCSDPNEFIKIANYLVRETKNTNTH